MPAPEKNIVIIGGGIIGCCSAYYLTQHPSYDRVRHRIIILESASKIAGGSSGKAGGLLAKWAFPAQIAPLSFDLHRQLADKHDGAENWGYRAVSCGEVACQGRFMRARDSTSGKNGEMDGENKTALDGQQHAEPARSQPKTRSGIPADLDWLDAGSLKSYDEVGNDEITDQVHPFQFTNYIAKLAQDAGVEIKLRTQVTTVDQDNNRVTGVTYTSPDGVQHLQATDVLISAGPWTSRVWPKAPISSFRVHSLTIRPSRPLSPYAVFTTIKLPSGFARTDESHNTSTSTHKPGIASRKSTSKIKTVTPEIYARPKNEAYISGESDHLVSLPETTDDVAVDEQRCQDIADYVASISDPLRDGEITARQACYLPVVDKSEEGGPLIGGLDVQGLWMAAGHSCWGIQNSTATGKIISELIFDGKAKCADISRFDPKRACR